jgi:hypothetical protein
MRSLRSSASRNGGGFSRCSLSEADVYQELRKSLRSAGEISSTEVSSYRALCGGAWRPRNQAFWRVQYTPWDQPNNPWYVAIVYPVESSCINDCSSASRGPRGRASRLPPKEIFESLLMLAELQYFLWKVREKYGATTIQKSHAHELFFCDDRRKERIDVTALLPDLDVVGWAGNLLRRLQSMENGGHTVPLGCWRVDPEEAYAGDIREWRRELVLTPTEALTVTGHIPKSQLQQHQSDNESDNNELAKRPAVPGQSTRKRKLNNPTSATNNGRKHGECIGEPVLMKEIKPVPVREDGKKDGPVVSESDHTDDEGREPRHPRSLVAISHETRASEIETMRQHQRESESEWVTGQMKQRVATGVDSLTGSDSALPQGQSEGYNSGDLHGQFYQLSLTQAADSHEHDHEHDHAPEVAVTFKHKTDSSDSELERLEVVGRSAKWTTEEKRQTVPLKRRRTQHSPTSTKATSTRSEDDEQGSLSDGNTDGEEFHPVEIEQAPPRRTGRLLRRPKRFHASIHCADIEDGSPVKVKAKTSQRQRQGFVKDGAKQLVVARASDSTESLAQSDVKESNGSEQHTRRSTGSRHVNTDKGDTETCDDSKPLRRSSRPRIPTFREGGCQEELGGEIRHQVEQSSARARRSRSVACGISSEHGRAYLVRIKANRRLMDAKLEAFVAADGLPAREVPPLSDPAQPAPRKYALRDRVARSYLDDLSESGLEESEHSNLLDTGDVISAAARHPAFVLSKSNRLSILNLLSEYDQVSCKRHGSCYSLPSYKNDVSARSAVDSLLDQLEALDEKHPSTEADDKECLEEQQLNNRIARLLAGRRNHEIHTRYKEKEQAEYLANAVRQEQWISKKKAPTMEETEWEQIVDRPIQFEATRTMRRARIHGKERCPCTKTSIRGKASVDDTTECRLCEDTVDVETAPDRSMFPTFYTIDTDAPEFLQKDEDPSGNDDQIKEAEGQEKKATRASKRMQWDSTKRHETIRKLTELKISMDFVESYNEGLLEKQVTGP